MEIFFSLLASLFILIGIIGVIVPALPGIALCYMGILLHYFLGLGTIAWTWLLIFGVLTIFTLILNYVIPLRTARKYGGSKWGDIGGLVGTFVGFLWIPVPFGFLIGMFAGVFLGEYIQSKQAKIAFKATQGALIGFLYSTTFSFLIGVSMLIVQLYYFTSEWLFA